MSDEDVEVVALQEPADHLEQGFGGRKDAFEERLGSIPTGGLSGLIVRALNHATNAPRSAGNDAQRDAERWGCLGPRNIGGACRCLAQHPTDANTFYTGAAWGGVWKTVDAGNSWRPTGLAHDSAPVGAIGIAGTNPNALYIGTGEPRLGDVSGTGLYKSIDAGGTYVRMAGTPGSPMPAAVGPSGASAGAANRYTRIIVDPANANRFWAASDSGLWRFEPGTGFVLEPVPIPGSAPVGTGAATDVAISIDPAEAAPAAGVARRRLRIFVGISGVGIFRGIFDRGLAPPSTAWGAAALAFPGAASVPAADLARIRLAICQGSPQFVYALFGQRSAASTTNRFRRSADGGTTWRARRSFAAAQPDYSMVIECHPTTPDSLVGGDLALFRCVNANQANNTWVRILNDLQYDLGDRAQHADQHAVVFDQSNPNNRLWVANDGGVSVLDTTGAAVWRKRSFGVVAAMFNDITTHPTFPFVMAGGLQDNGSYVGFGGPTWYHLDGGDGGTVAFDPANPRRFYTSFAAGNGGVNEHAVLANPAGALGPNPIVSTVVADRAAPNNRFAVRFPVVPNFPAANPGLFSGLTVHHPRDPNTLVIGRGGSAFASVNGGTTFPTRIPGAGNAFNPPNASVSAIAFANRAAVAANDDWWLGTNFGELFLSQNGQSGPWTNVAVPWPGGNVARIASIVVHPLQPTVVAIAGSGANGRVFVTHDRGTSWCDVTGVAAAAPTQDLPPGPKTALAWDPANPRILYAGTLAGVYVVRDLPAFAGANALPPAPAAAVHWQGFNEGLPLILIQDLEIVPVTNTIRVATFGRGIFEANTAAAAAPFFLPPVRLSIRSHIKDDGQRNYPAANTTADDFRQFAVGPAVFDFVHAYDIRVDAPPFLQVERARFGEVLDGVEFDEDVTIEQPIAGELNRVHVQVHNRGTAEASNVSLHLYFAEAVGGVAPSIVPADFNFPDEPAAASVWQRVDTPRTIGRLRSAHPNVVRFPWVPPLTLAGKNVALLALATDDQDALAAVPAAPALTLVTTERRAALHILPVRANPVFIRDGVDDDGRIGTVAWSGRSPDIVVDQAVHANPNGDFGADRTNRRLTDRVRPGNNFIYVRVSNRAAVATPATVDVWEVAYPSLDKPALWRKVNAAPIAVNVPAGTSAFAAVTPAAAPWRPGAPPAPATAWALVAVVSSAGAPLPDFTNEIRNLDSMWRAIRSGEFSDRVALRALRFVP